MKENFDKAFNLVIGAEGGYSNDPNDPGGETNFGICKRDHPNEDIKNMTLKRAKEIYKPGYWDAINANNLPDKVDIFLFDTAVNQGVSVANYVNTVSKGWPDMVRVRLRRYTKLVTKNPNLKRYLHGWVIRVLNLWDELG